MGLRNEKNIFQPDKKTEKQFGICEWKTFPYFLDFEKGEKNIIITKATTWVNFEENKARITS